MKQTHLATLLSAITVVLLCSSCSVTDKNKLDGFAALEVWKQSADSVQAQQSPSKKAAYLSASIAVETAISVKKQEASAVADSWLPIGKIDGSLAAIESVSQGIRGKVTTALNQEVMADPVSGGAVVVAEIAEYLRKAAVEGRKKEAEALSKRLESYKWKAW